MLSHTKSQHPGNINLMSMTYSSQLLTDIAHKTEQTLEKLLPEAHQSHDSLVSAMRYAVLGTGKRFRPFLVLITGRLFGLQDENLLRVASAIECVHAHFLVFDDLPCMDDDDLRRGRPTVHKAYDEATALLAGDALLTLAFEVIAHPETHASGEVRVQLACTLARASGAEGMVGGQMLDLDAASKPADLDSITHLQNLKTGALITCSVACPALMAGADHKTSEALKAYAQDMGLVFQIVDDLLDLEGIPERVGKSLNKDARQGKATFPELLGVEGARQKASFLTERAKAHLEIFGPAARSLRDAVEYALLRDR